MKADSPYKTLKDPVDAAKANPGEDQDGRLLGGHVDAVLTNPVAFKPYLTEGGELRLLAIMGDKESPLYPGAKTMAEAGYDVKGGISYQTLNVPAGTPPEIVDTLSNAVKKALDTEDYQKKIEPLGTATHSQSLDAWFAHVPGLKVVMPSTPYDYKGPLKTAVRDPNPVVFIEHKLLYRGKGPVPAGE